MSATIIGRELSIEGTVQSKGEVRLEGVLLGDVQCLSFTLGTDGEMQGKIEAEQVRLHGQLTGKVKGGEVMLFKDARVKGDITHQGIAIEMGAQYDGRLKSLVQRQSSKPR